MTADPYAITIRNAFLILAWLLLCNNIMPFPSRLCRSVLYRRYAELAERGIEVLGKYISANHRLLVRCQCGHEWTPKASQLFNGHGCHKCKIQKQRLSPSQLDERYAELAGRGITVIGQYLAAAEKISVRCKCGYQWKARACDLFKGGGCRKCAFERINRLNRLSESDLGERYAELNARGITVTGEFTGSLNDLRVRCKCGREWKSKASSLFEGVGCANCAVSGFQPSKAGTLYYVRVLNLSGASVYKIGITNLTVKKRFRQEFSKVTILGLWHFANGAEAQEMEQKILIDYSADRYQGPAVFSKRCRGNDELFRKDVLKLDRYRSQQEFCYDC
jgi:hypothetical protein